MENNKKVDDSLEVVDFENTDMNVNEFVDDSLTINEVQPVEDLLNAIC